jgi:predicted ester cyclase
MSTEVNKTLILRLKQVVINGRNPEAAGDFFAVDYRNDVPGRLPGLEGLKHALREFFAVFPDVQETIDQMVAEGEMVATRSTIRATHQGLFVGVPATGRHVTFSIQEISRIREGKVREQWVNIDLFGLLTQLNTLAPPGSSQ